MNVHKNARKTVHGRVLLCQRICREGVSERTAYRWLARWRAALEDRPSAPHRSPRHPAPSVVREIL